MLSKFHVNGKSTRKESFDYSCLFCFRSLCPHPFLESYCCFGEVGGFFYTLLASDLKFEKIGSVLVSFFLHFLPLFFSWWCTSYKMHVFLTFIAFWQNVFLPDISAFLPPPYPSCFFFPSLISLMVSVEVKHHVYLLTNSPPLLSPCHLTVLCVHGHYTADC